MHTKGSIRLLYKVTNHYLVPNLVQLHGNRFPNIFPNANDDPIKNFEVSIVLKDDVNPVFCKGYSVPYALRDKVESELKSMVTKNILTPSYYI